MLFRRPSLLRLWCLPLAGLLVGAGCRILPEAQPDPTRYYVLAGSAEPRAGRQAPDGLTVGLRPIELPGYLRNNRSMVVARGPNEVTFLDYERWAEPLDLGIQRIVREALVTEERVGRVVLSPFNLDQPPDFEIAIRVHQAEGVDTGSGQSVRFVAAYEIVRPDEPGRIVRQGVYVAPERAWNGDAAALAQQLADAAAAAGEAIAAQLPE